MTITIMLSFEFPIRNPASPASGFTHLFLKPGVRILVRGRACYYIVQKCKTKNGLGGMLQLHFCLQTNSLQRVFERSSFRFPQFLSSLLNFVSSPGYCPAANIVALPKLMIASDRKMISRKETAFCTWLRNFMAVGKFPVGPHIPETEEFWQCGSHGDKGLNVSENKAIM